MPFRKLTALLCAIAGNLLRFRRFREGALPTPRVRAFLRRWNCKYREGYNESLTKESTYASVGPQMREIVTKFGSQMVPRAVEFDRKTLRQSNGVTAHRESMGRGLFADSANARQLEASLVPARAPALAREATTERYLLDTSVAATKAEYRNRHPPPYPHRGAVPQADTTSNAPYAWKPEQPGSVTYGFHRRW